MDWTRAKPSRKRIAVSPETTSPEPLCFVIPVLNEARALPGLVESLRPVLDERNARVLFVDDGSTDETIHVLRGLRDHDPRIGHIRLSRNFGKEQALSAGLKAVPDGHSVLVMDGDGQHTPEAVRTLLNEADAQPAAQLVFGVRRDRDYQSGLERGLSRLFYRMAAIGARQSMDPRTGDFFYARASAADVLRRFEGAHLVWKGVYGFVGLERRTVEIDIAPRGDGRSRIGMAARLGLAIRAMVWTSKAPLHLISLTGLLISAVAFLTGLYSIGEYFVTGVTAPGFYTLVVTQSLIGGMILLSLGVIAQYLAAILDNTSARPSVIVADETGMPEFHK